MIKLLIEIISRFLESYFTNVPEIPKDWSVINRLLFYAGATLIYIFAFTVIFSVYLIVIIVAQPVSMAYNQVK